MQLVIDILKLKVLPYGGQLKCQFGHKLVKKTVKWVSLGTWKQVVLDKRFFESHQSAMISWNSEFWNRLTANSSRFFYGRRWKNVRFDGWRLKFWPFEGWRLTPLRPSRKVVERQERMIILSCRKLIKNFVVWPWLDALNWNTPNPIGLRLHRISLRGFGRSVALNFSRYCCSDLTYLFTVFWNSQTKQKVNKRPLDQPNLNTTTADGTKRTMVETPNKSSGIQLENLQCDECDDFVSSAKRAKPSKPVYVFESDDDDEIMTLDWF